MPEKYHYSAYGLHIIADRSLPEVLPASAPKSDANSVSIHLTGDTAVLPMQPERDEVPFYTHPHQTKNGMPTMEVWRNDERYFLRYFNGSQFVISRDGKNIWAGWAADTDFSIITAIILGPILGLVLRLRGLLILHASVVADDDHALAIVGTSGAGNYAGKASMPSAMILPRSIFRMVVGGHSPAIRVCVCVVNLRMRFRRRGIRCVELRLHTSRGINAIWSWTVKR